MRHHIVWILAGLLACSGSDEPLEGDAAGECSDAADNDVDGLFDCDDPDCAGSSDCAGDTDPAVSDSDTDDATDDTEVPLDLPDNVDALIPMVFDGIDDPAHLGELLSALGPYLDAVNTSGNASAREIDVDLLSTSHLSALTVPEGTDPQNLLAVALVSASPHAVDEHQSLTLVVDRGCLFSPDEVRTRSFDSGEDCFLSSTCLALRAEDASSSRSLIGSIDVVLQEDYRLVQVGDETWMASRTWIEQRHVSDNDVMALEQLYGLDVWMPGVNGSTRLQVRWQEQDHDAVDDELARTIMRGFLDQVEEAQDDFLTDDLNTCE